MRCLVWIAIGLGIAAAAQTASAEAGGPDYWNVSGVRTDDVLNLHKEASAKSPVVARIPPRETGLKNLGCTGMPTFVQWQGMTAAERARSSKARWCQVDFRGQRGWVAGRFLSEGSAKPTGSSTTTVGPWTLRCASSVCAIEQVGIGATRRTLIRIEPRPADSAQVIVERAGLPAKGTLSIYMDGELISEGPIAPIRSKDGKSLAMTPDDITAGLMRQMVRHQNMVLSLPGEDRGVEFHLDHFSEARKQLDLLRGAAAR